MVGVLNCRTHSKTTGTTMYNFYFDTLLYLHRVTVHFTGTITRTSIYSNLPGHTAYWTLNYATASNIGSLSAVKIIFRSCSLAGFANDNYRDLQTVIFYKN